MKIEIEINEVDILERYSRADGHRDWGRMSWLYPGDIVAQISGESAKRIIIATESEFAREKVPKSSKKATAKPNK
jgi:hypothetical protein